jgi:sigma-E factor negative regulatory protein RseC
VETGRLIIEAQNSLGAKVDDLVEFELPTGQFIRDSIMVFIIPLVALFVGYMVGVQVVSSEIAGIILALIFFVAGIFAVRWYDKNVVTRAQLRATITKIIN